MQTYQKIILIILILSGVASLVLLFRKKKEDKDKNLKISIALINKENYEKADSDSVENTNSLLDKSEDCNKILSLLGDSNMKGLNNIYEDITGKNSPLKLPIDCSKFNNDNMNNMMVNLLIMINEMSFKAIENKDQEKGYNDLVALFLFVLGKLNSNYKINILYDSKGKVEFIELMTDNGLLTPQKMIDNINSSPEREPQGKTPEINDIIKKTREEAKNKVKISDLDSLKTNNNSKIKVYDLGIILSNILAKDGSIVK
jgi:hypothetical protein